MEHLRPEKDGRSWIVTPKDEGWVFERTYPTKWKAHVAISIWHQGGSLQNYFEAAREEKKRRRQRAKKRKKEKAGEEEEEQHSSESVGSAEWNTQDPSIGESWQRFWGSWYGLTVILLAGLLILFGGWGVVATGLESVLTEWSPGAVAASAMVVWSAVLIGAARIYEHFSSTEEETSREQPVSLSSESEPLTLNQIGRLLADEARKWAVDAMDSVREADYPKEISDEQEQLEMYILILAAFVDSTQAFGVDGLTVQTVMIDSAPAVAASILEDPHAQDLDEIRKRITDRLSEYLAITPRGGSAGEFLQFGGLAAKRVIGAHEEDPYAALLLHRPFQIAQNSSLSLLRKVLT